jgi:hypothetical protein
MYVEVIYLKDKRYISRRWKTYDDDQAPEKFRQAVADLKKRKIECLVLLRTDDHKFITSQMIEKQT